MKVKEREEKIDSVNVKNKKQPQKDSKKATKSEVKTVEKKEISKTSTKKQQGKKDTSAQKKSNKTENKPKDKIVKGTIYQTETLKSKKTPKQEKKKKDPNEFFVIDEKKPSKFRDILFLFGILALSFIIMLFIVFCIFTIINMNNPNIINGVYIKGINVSNLSKEEAKQKVENYISKSLPDEIYLKHNDFEASITANDLELYFNVDEAVDLAFNIGRSENLIKNNFLILETIFSKVNVNPGFSINEKNLKKALQDISNKLPDKIVDSSYYIEDSNLILTKGSPGSVINIDASIRIIKNNINKLNFDEAINLFVYKKYPQELNIAKIHKEIYKEPVDAYYTQEPFAVFPSEDGIDFGIPLEEVKNILQEDKDEYIVPLKVIPPNITTNMIGTEAFPDLLSESSTKYAASNRNRTTNLILAANKINGTVVMPGEVFSYNKVVGERTIAAGYKEAPIYVQGRVEDGLGGGICQITTTLYNAVLLSNLEIVERSNHQFVPSYSPASLDATVVYGVIDFKFKNNRQYPIKLVCSVENGIANFKVFGLKSDDDYQVQLSSRTTGSNANYIYSSGYKTLIKDGAVVSTEVISNDVYKRH